MTRKPCDKELAAELVTAVKEIYTGDIPVTVNGVRQRAEEKLDLDKGFFKQESWKDRSKQIIKDVVAKLDSGEAVTPSPTVPKPLKGQKRASQADAEEQTPTPNKRQRKQPPSAKAKADETDPSETPAKKRSRKPEHVQKGKKIRNSVSQARRARHISRLERNRRPSETSRFQERRLVLQRPTQMWSCPKTTRMSPSR